MKSIIHVHRQRLGQGLPAIIVRRRGRAEHYSRVQIAGPSTIVHAPDKTRQPRVWIETTSEVTGE